MSALVLFVVVLATCVLVAWAVAAGQRALAYAAPRASWPAFIGWSWAHAIWVALPAMVTLLGLVVLLVPNLSSLVCHCTSHGVDHPHLCVDHPALAAPLLPLALCVLGLWLGTGIPRMVRLRREIRTGEQWARVLAAAPVEIVDGIGVHVVDDLALGAFTVGVRRPVIVVDRELWRRLSAVERRAIVHHENAHVARRDGLTLAVLRALAAWIPWPVGPRLVAGWKGASERLCDRHAARRLGDAIAVAQTLVSVERIRAGLPAGSPRPAALGVAAGADLEQRVMTLLDRTEPGARGPSLRSDLVVTAIAVLALAAIAVVLPRDSFHHAVETVIGHLAP